MTDKELLEKAAKAAGYGLPSEDDHDEIGRQYCSELGLWVSFNGWWGWFQPLKSDGGALRLAVKLGFVVHVWGDGEGVSVAKSTFDGCAPDDGDNSAWFFECAHSSSDDICAATRRAITRAAAAMAD